MKQFYREGQLFEKSEIWAEGLDKWCHLSSVAQFRWTICCSGKHALPNAPGSSPQTQSIAANSDDSETGIR